MLLYLLRHAEAEAFASSDAERRLTTKGRGQAERVGKFCRGHSIRPDVILSSPVARASATAKIVSDAAGCESLEVPWAACGMDPETAINELRGYEKFPSVMLVGHQPDLGCLCAALIGSSDAALHVRKALLMAVDIHRKPVAGAGILQFFIPVRFM